MVYLGSKNKISGIIKPILENALIGKSCYIEPFVGGANMIDKIDFDNKIGYDINKYLIALLNRMLDGDIEYYFLQKEDYYSNYLHPFKKNGEVIINGKKLEDWELGFIFFTKTFNSKFANGYSGITKKENFQKEKFNNIKKQSEKELFKNCKFIQSEYKDIIIPENSVVYLDPPYINKTDYKTKFNHNEFYNWCKEISLIKGVEIYLSELEAPQELFETVLEIEHKHEIKKSDKKIIEKIYRFKK